MTYPVLIIQLSEEIEAHVHITNIYHLKIYE